MGSTTCTASKVKRLAAQEPLVNHQSFSLDKFSSKSDRFSGNFLGLGSFCLVWFVCLLGLFFYSTTTLDPFSYQRLGTVCLFLQLCSFSTSVFMIYKTRQIMLPYSQRTSWRITNKPIENFETMQIFKRRLCLYYSSSLKLAFYTSNRKKKRFKTRTPSTPILRKAVLQLRTKKKGERY